MVGRAVLVVGVLGSGSVVQAQPEPLPAEPTPRKLFALSFGMTGTSRLDEAPPTFDIGSLAMLFGRNRPTNDPPARI